MKLHDTIRTTICLVSAAVSVCILHVDSALAQTTIPSVTTYHNDVGRTGQNLQETILTLENVNPTQFGKLFSYPLDGQAYAQPLYVPGVTIPGKGVHNVVYVATENDDVYAFDADNATANPLPLWHTSFINSPNVVPVPANCATTACTIQPYQGITGTPVISTAAKTIYFVARTQETSTTTSKVSYYYRLHALDITTGAEKAGSPVVICGVTSPNTGCVIGAGRLNTVDGNQRPALLLLPQTGTAEGVVYVGFVNAGMLLAYDASTLKQLASWTSVPNPEFNAKDVKVSGGLWGSGNAIAAGDSGNIFVVVGDGFWDGATNYGDSVVRLNLKPGTTKGTFQFVVEDYFTPADQECRAENDADLGAGGLMVLPTQTGSTPHELVTAGKGNAKCDSGSPIEIVNTQNMGHLAGQVQSFQGSLNGYWATPAYWEPASGKRFLYYGGLSFSGQGDYLRQYILVKGQVDPVSSIAESSEIYWIGATPSISANAGTNGIVWAIQRMNGLEPPISTVPGVLHAYDARNIATELYNSNMNPTRDQAAPVNKFAVPTVVNGKVYVGTQTELDVYGLLAK
jgi:PQQ-like domain